MKIKRLGIVALVYILVGGIFGITAEAESFSERDPVYLEELPCDTLDGATVKLIGSHAAQRAMQTLNVTVSANMVGVADESFPLEAEEIVKLNCTYSPDSANIDFGLIAPDGYFYYVNSTSGSIKQSIKVSKRGDYTLAIRNNSSEAVSIAGYVYY